MGSVNPVLLQKIVEHAIDTDEGIAKEVFSDKYLIIQALSNPFKEQFYATPESVVRVIKDFRNAIVNRKDAISKLSLDVRNKDIADMPDALADASQVSTRAQSHFFEKKMLSKADEYIIQRFVGTGEVSHINTLITLYVCLANVLPLSMEQYAMLSSDAIHTIFYRSSFIARMYKIVVSHIQKPASFLLHHIRAFFTYFFNLSYDAQEVLLRLPLVLAMQLIVEIDVRYYCMMLPYSSAVRKGTATTITTVPVLDGVQSTSGIPPSARTDSAAMSARFLALIDKAAMQHPLEFIAYIQKNL